MLSQIQLYNDFNHTNNDVECKQNIKINVIALTIIEVIMNKAYNNMQQF